jgi:type IV pilus assembly protein PilC
MGMYSYECLSKSGEIIKGQITGDNQENIIEQLRKFGYSIIDIKEVKKNELNGFFSTQKKVKTVDLSILSRQLSSMLNAGIPLTRALSTLGKQTENPTLKSALISITKNVESGMNFTDSLAAYPKIFSKLFLGMVYAGELGGILDKTLETLSIQLQKEKSLNDNIKSATMYPRVILGFAGILIVCLLVFLIPVFVNLFPKGTAIPLPTQIIIQLSDFVRFRWYIIVLVLIALIFGMKSYISSESGKSVWDKMKFKMPAFGKLIKKTVVARFTRTLATLLDAGIPVLQSLETAGSTSGSVLLYDSIIKAAKRIEEGRDIAGEFEKTEMFPPMVIHMVAIGEETGSLPLMLSKVADFYEEEVATMTKGLTALIEPIMLVAVGLVVGFMLISMYLPIFTAVTAVT